MDSCIRNDGKERRNVPAFAGVGSRPPRGQVLILQCNLLSRWTRSTAAFQAPCCLGIHGENNLGDGHPPRELDGCAAGV